MPGTLLNTRRSVLLAGIALWFALSGCQPAAIAEDRPFFYEDDDILMRLVLRSPEQLTGFYLGREFNPAAVDKILATCFIAAIVVNKTDDVLWLELDNWRFTAGKAAILRFKRDYWQAQWREVELPQRHQSTFGWTLLPEARDLRVDESVGGNLALAMQSQPFTLTAHFHTGADKQGELKTVVFKDIPCPGGAP